MFLQSFGRGAENHKVLGSAEAACYKLDADSVFVPDDFMKLCLQAHRQSVCKYPLHEVFQVELVINRRK